MILLLVALFSLVYSYREILTITETRNLILFENSPFSFTIDSSNALNAINFAFGELFNSVQKACNKITDQEFNQRFSLFEPLGLVSIFEKKDIYSCERFHDEISSIRNYISGLLTSDGYSFSLPNTCDSTTAKKGKCHFSIELSDDVSINIVIEKNSKYGSENIDNHIPYVSIVCEGCDNMFLPCDKSAQCPDSLKCVPGSEIIKTLIGFIKSDSFKRAYNIIPSRKLFEDFGFMDDLNSIAFSPEDAALKFFQKVAKQYFQTSVDSMISFGLCMPSLNLNTENFLSLGNVAKCSNAFSQIFCNGKIMTDETVCSGHGVCKGNNTCVCQEGYSGSDCAISSVGSDFTCFGLSSSSAGVCSERGSCIGTDTCSCNSGYSGNQCENVATCYDLSRDSSSVCSGHGSCIGKNNCSCESGFYGEKCQNAHSCYEISADNEKVCGGNGKCVSNNKCECFLSYTGDTCESRILCSEIPANDLSVCSGNGKCTATDTCSCIEGFSGKNCQTDNRKCGQFAFNDPLACSGMTHGECVSNNGDYYCSCKDGFFGENCSGIVFCGELSSQSSSVCGGNGVCKGYSSSGSCYCRFPYTGSQCESVIKCNGIASTDESVCGGFGICTSTDTCTCDEEHKGDFCGETISCDGISALDEKVCEGKYKCTKDGCKKPSWNSEDCGCAKKFLGLLKSFDGSSISTSERKSGEAFTAIDETPVEYQYDSQRRIPFLILEGFKSKLTFFPSHKKLKTSFAFEEANELLYYIHNIMKSFRSSQSTSAYDSQSYFMIWNALPYLRRFFEDANGFQKKSDGNEDFIVKFLNQLELPEWFKRISTVSSCSYETFIETGKCSFKFYGLKDLFNQNVTIYVNIENEDFSSSLPNIEIFCEGDFCHEAFNLKTCMKNSDCSSNNCVEVLQGNSITSEKFVSPRAVYSFKGEEFDAPQDPFNNKYFRYFYTPDLVSRPGITFFVSLLKYFRGTSSLEYETEMLELDSLRMCMTPMENFTNENLNNWVYRWFERKSSSSKSLLIDDYFEEWNVKEGETDYSWTSDSTISCGGVAATNSKVCGGHGKCVAKDECSCDSLYQGDNCELFTCNDVRSDNPFVCSGHGKCTAVDTCVCSKGYYGEKCNQPVCYGVMSTDSSVCSGHGTCEATDTCNCVSGYLGDSCGDVACFSERADSESVCSGHGKCTGADQCVCEAGYYGKRCNQRQCFNILSSNPTVCGAHGKCTNTDTCSCNSGYRGSKCGDILCFGVWSSETSTKTICSGHGTCSAHNLCTCQDGYAGAKCEFRTLTDGRFAILMDNFERSSSLSSSVWNTTATKCNLVSGTKGCGGLSGSGNNLFCSGKVDERVIYTAPVSVSTGVIQNYYLSFYFLMASKNTDECKKTFSIDKVYVGVEYLSEDQSFVESSKTLTVLNPFECSGKTKKVEIVWKPSQNFRIKIYQPSLYSEGFGQWSIDSFFLTIKTNSSTPKAPCSMNGDVDSNGECVCYDSKSKKADDCIITGCKDPIISSIDSSIEVLASGGSSLELSGCFDDIKECRFYPSYLDPTYKTYSSVVSVTATTYNQKKVICIVPAQSKIGSDQIKVDIRQNGGNFTTVEGLVLNYVDSVSTSLTSVATVNESGAIIWSIKESYLQTWKYSKTDISLKLILIKEFSDFTSCNFTCSAFEEVLVVKTGISLIDEKLLLKSIVSDKTYNPKGLRLYAVEATCYYEGTKESFSCTSYVKRRKLSIPKYDAQKYCSSFFSVFSKGSDAKFSEWKTLPSCPSTHSYATWSQSFEIEKNCNPNHPESKTCNFIYPDAYSCFVSKKSVSTGTKRRRCCYDAKEQLISGSSAAASYYCAEGETACTLPSQKNTITHYDADSLPCEVCGKDQSQSEEVLALKPTSSTSSSVSSSCSASGDPHFVTFNNNHFDFMGECSYIILRTPNNDQLEVQGHFYGERVSIVTAVAFKHHYLSSTPKIQIRSTGSAVELRVNDVVTDYTNKVDLGTELSMTVSGDSFTFTYTTGEVLAINANPGILSYSIRSLPSDKYSGGLGLCGSCNTDDDTKVVDLVYANQKSYVTSLSDTSQIYEFGYSWTVDPADVLFHYESGYYKMCSSSPPKINSTDIPDVRTLFTNKTQLAELESQCKEFTGASSTTALAVDQCLYDIYALGDTESVLEQSGNVASQQRDEISSSLVIPIIVYDSSIFEENGFYSPKSSGEESAIGDLIVRQSQKKSIVLDLTGGKSATENSKYTLSVSSILVVEETAAMNALNVTDAKKYFTISNLKKVLQKDIRNDNNGKDVVTWSFDVLFSDVRAINMDFSLVLQLCHSESSTCTSASLPFRTLCISSRVGTECDQPACYDVGQVDENVCSGNGECLSDNYCECSVGYFGENCDYYSVKEKTPIIRVITSKESYKSSDKIYLMCQTYNESSDDDIYYHWTLSSIPTSLKVKGVTLDGSFDSLSQISLTTINQKILVIEENTFNDDSTIAFRCEAKNSYGVAYAEKFVTIDEDLPSQESNVEISLDSANNDVVIKVNNNYYEKNVKVYANGILISCGTLGENENSIIIPNIFGKEKVSFEVIVKQSTTNSSFSVEKEFTVTLDSIKEDISQIVDAGDLVIACSDKNYKYTEEELSSLVEKLQSISISKENLEEILTSIKGLLYYHIKSYSSNSEELSNSLFSVLSDISSDFSSSIDQINNCTSLYLDCLNICVTMISQKNIEELEDILFSIQKSKENGEIISDSKSFFSISQEKKLLCANAFKADDKSRLILPTVFNDNGYSILNVTYISQTLENIKAFKYGEENIESSLQSNIYRIKIDGITSNQDTTDMNDVFTFEVTGDDLSSSTMFYYDPETKTWKEIFEDYFKSKRRDASSSNNLQIVSRTANKIVIQGAPQYGQNSVDISVAAMNTNLSWVYILAIVGLLFGACCVFFFCVPLLIFFAVYLSKKNKKDTSNQYVELELDKMKKSAQKVVKKTGKGLNAQLINEEDKEETEEKNLNVAENKPEVPPNKPSIKEVKPDVPKNPPPKNVTNIIKESSSEKPNIRLSFLDDPTSAPNTTVLIVKDKKLPAPPIPEKPLSILKDNLNQTISSKEKKKEITKISKKPDFKDDLDSDEDFDEDNNKFEFDEFGNKRNTLQKTRAFYAPVINDLSRELSKRKKDN